MGNLILLTVPIGNILDLTSRALSVLKEETYFLVEDTRVFKDLLRELHLPYDSKEFFPYHEHTKGSEEKLLSPLSGGKNVCVVSDAGSPLLSDPAYPLIQKALEMGAELKVISGVTAVVSALELSGLPPIPFTFHGFVPRVAGKRSTYFKDYFSKHGTHIFFEGVSRIYDSLSDLTEIYPDKKMVIAREITKTHESVYRFVGSDFQKIYPEITLKGEFVILMYQDNIEELSSNKITAEARSLMENGISQKGVAKLLSLITGEKTKEIYQKLIK